MAKEDLQTRLLKGVLRIDKNVADGVDVLRDLSMKLCHVIKYKGNYHSVPEGNDYD
jgi:hypothetical protein